MENSDQAQPESVNPKLTKPAPRLLIAGVSAVVIGAIAIWLFSGEQEAPLPLQPVVIQPVAPTPEPVVEVEVAPEPEPVVIEPEPVEEVVQQVVEPLPTLDESDSWIKAKLPKITWRKELLKVIIDEDMIRRFVVFTDNFSQGVLAYEHSPFVLPNTGFSAIETKEFNNNQQVLVWDEQSSRRFSLYVDLLRSIDSDSLVQWYSEMKPLFDEAYAELGYPDSDFTDTLLDAITRVLDMELPKTELEIIRPSVMYQYKDPNIESLDDTDKLLLRMGKDNLLVIKSVLLELNEKLARQQGGEQ